MPRSAGEGGVERAGLHVLPERGNNPNAWPGTVRPPTSAGTATSAQPAAGTCDALSRLSMRRTASGNCSSSGPAGEDSARA